MMKYTRCDQKYGAYTGTNIPGYCETAEFMSRIRVLAHIICRYTSVVQNMEHKLRTKNISRARKGIRQISASCVTQYSTEQEKGNFYADVCS